MRLCGLHGEEEDVSLEGGCRNVWFPKFRIRKFHRHKRGKQRGKQKEIEGVSFLA
jgi:hypothetical protein